MDVKFGTSGSGDLFDFTIADTQQLGAILAKAFHEKLISNIKSNKFGYIIKPATLRRRHSDGGVSVMPMINTGSYLQHIVVNGGVVSIMDGAVERSRLNFTQLGDLLEYGRVDKGFGGYPHWRPTLEEFKEDMERIIIDFYQKKLSGR